MCRKTVTDDVINIRIVCEIKRTHHFQCALYENKLKTICIFEYVIGQNDTWSRNLLYLTSISSDFICRTKTESLGVEYAVIPRDSQFLIADTHA